MKSRGAPPCQASHSHPGLHHPFSPEGRALFLQIHLSCPRQHTLGQLLPWGPLLTVLRVTLQASSSSDGSHRKWRPWPFIFPRRGKAPCPSFISSQTDWNEAAILPQVPSKVYARPLWHRNQTLSALSASGFILSRASALSREWSGAFRVACQALETQGIGHSVLRRRKTLTMSLEYFSHFKKGYGSRECPPAALRWAPRWASRLAGVPKWLAETNYGQSSSRERGEQVRVTEHQDVHCLFIT